MANETNTAATGAVEGIDPAIESSAVSLPHELSDRIDTLKEQAATNAAATGMGEYDRELIAKMLGRLIGFGNTVTSYSYQEIKDQIRLLREADNRYVSRAHTVIKGETE